MFMLLFAEKKLDSFVASHHDSSIENPSVCHRDNNPMLNCSDTGVSVAGDVEHGQLHGEVSDSRIVTSLCSLPDISELKFIPESEAADVSSRDEVTCTDRWEKFSADLSRTANKVDRFDDVVTDTSTEVLECDVLTDRNCNSILISNSRSELNGEKVCCRYSKVSPSISVVDDRISPPAPVPNETNVITAYEQDLPPFVMVMCVRFVSDCGYGLGM